MILTAFSFIFALGILIAIHEYGHYRVAVACGVKVLRFSIGIGKPLLRWKSQASGTEFVIAALPLGGYVRMLDERVEAVSAAQQHQAFNRQPLAKRAAIVAAGPAANLILAVVLYSLVNWLGVQEPRAIISAPVAGSMAENAGLRSKDLIAAVQVANEGTVPVLSFEDFRWRVTQAALQGRDVTLSVEDAQQLLRQVLLPLSKLGSGQLDQNLLTAIGVTQPWSAPVIGDISVGGPAYQAGLQPGDEVLRIGVQEVHDAAQLRQFIRESVAQLDGAQAWLVQRSGQQLYLQVTPEMVHAEQQTIGRIGAYVGGMPQLITVQKGLWQGLADGVIKTWDISWLSLKMMAKMLVGEASLKNLSGPLTIADYAGKSASVGFVQYLLFLALISVSLGVLNLLPLPVLDGGHLMYYLWEGVTGQPVSDMWMERLQRVGISLLLVMMSIAFFNDISRIWG